MMHESTNLQVWRNALPALRAFSEQNIPIIVLKSLPQIEELYGDLGSRLTLDVDLFVPGRQMLSAFSACVGAGYQPKTGEYYPDLTELSAKYGQEAALCERKWTLVPTRPGDCFDIDLHNDGIAIWRSAALRADVWSRATISERDSVTFHLLSPEDRLIFLCWSITAEVARRSKAADIAQILRHGENLDWGFIAAQSRRLGLAMNVQLVCDLTTLWFGLDISPYWRRPLSLPLRVRHALLLRALCSAATPLPKPWAQIITILGYDHPIKVWLPAVKLWLRRQY